MSETKVFCGLSKKEMLDCSDSELEDLFFPYKKVAKILAFLGLVFGLIVAVVYKDPLRFLLLFMVFSLGPLLFVTIVRAYIPFLLSPAREKLTVHFDSSEIKNLSTGLFDRIKIFWWLPSWVQILPAKNYILISIGFQEQCKDLRSFICENGYFDNFYDIYRFGRVGHPSYILMTKENAARFLKFITNFNNAKVEGSYVNLDDPESVEKLLTKRGGIIRIDS